VPIVPTSARDFAPGEQIEAFLRVFQGGTAPIVPIAMNTGNATAWATAFVPVWAMALAAATVRFFPAWREPPGPGREACSGSGRSIRVAV